MRMRIRGVIVGLALTATALALAACQKQQGPASETSQATPSNAQREAELAAQQLAALGGAANAGQRALYEGEFQASGDVGAGEGAWELRLLGDYAQFSRPGLGEDGGVTSERDFHAKGMRVSAGPLTITIMQQACTASGIDLPYTANVLFEGVAYQGCARRGIDEGARPTWASVLPELIPAIDACLARASARQGRVTFASAINDGAVSVRIRQTDGRRYECIADAEQQIAVYEPLSDDDRRSGEGDPEFQRGESSPSGGACTALEAVSGRDGEQLGWLVRRSC